jgi:hypothetical protein
LPGSEYPTFEAAGYAYVAQVVLQINFFAIRGTYAVEYYTAFVVGYPGRYVVFIHKICVKTSSFGKGVVKIIALLPFGAGSIVAVFYAGATGFGYGGW